MVRLIITIQLLLLITACGNHSDNNGSFLLKPVTDSAYHYKVESAELVSRRQTPSVKQTAFTISFRAVNDSIYAFSFRLTSIDTSVLQYLDRMDSLRQRKPTAAEIRNRAGYIIAFNEATHDFFQGRVDNKGQLLSLKGFDAMKERISTKLNLDPRDVYSMLHELAGDPAVEKLLNMVFMCVAGKKVKVEDTWVRNIIDRTRSPLKHSHLVTFTALRGDTAFLNLQTEISAKTGPEGTLFESGKGTGEWKVDWHTGMPMEWNSVQETEYRTAHDTLTRTIRLKGQWIP